ncbi:MAG: hypothetical protein COV99_08435 [Bacteroidetes bacterium CG12_big_fil_rev_8_21_14_0_65_60_17]|nr:MAG: hypothetical protein COV99_08435 [Bacteroidetes bacterium CG12_big_fil_rev_8_21_14_0_65_60_17]
MGHLLAVDLGLRTGLACFTGEGALLWYRSQNYGSRARLKKAAWSLLSEMSRDGAPVTRLVIEGGGDLAPPWINEAGRRGIAVTQIQAETWRRALLYDRQQRSGTDAKRHAGELARSIIRHSGLPRPTSLRHDAAEAILIGHWALSV